MRPQAASIVATSSSHQLTFSLCITGGAADKIPQRGTSEISGDAGRAAQRQWRRRRIFRWRRGIWSDIRPTAESGLVIISIGSISVYSTCTHLEFGDFKNNWKTSTGKREYLFPIQLCVWAASGRSNPCQKFWHQFWLKTAWNILPEIAFNWFLQN